MESHWYNIVIVVVTFLCSFHVHFSNAGQQKLNDFISHYETLTYDGDEINRQHKRLRRSTTDFDDELHLNFFAHEREFRLRLRRDTEAFRDAPDVFMMDGKLSQLDISHIFRGHLKDEEDRSYVYGSIINGIFSGRIELPYETYNVDKSELYFNGRQEFHSVIYLESDVIHSPPERKDGGSCGNKNHQTDEWMREIQNSAVNVPPTQKKKMNDNKRKSPMDFRNRYLIDMNNKERVKRDVSNNVADDRMCSLLIQSDPQLWDYMTRPATDSFAGLGYSTSQAKDEIAALFAGLVDGIKRIYMNTTFQYGNVGPYNNITFAVHRMQINTTADCNNSANANPFCQDNLDVSTFLNMNSQSDHDLYCLAFVFTFRDFDQGTLGLAWVGSYQGAAGGICDKWKPYSINNQQMYMSLNTGIVSLSNYGVRVPPPVSILTFAHEVGHGFGSPHDTGNICQPLSVNPNDPLGNFIMYAMATSGTQPNNQRFSPCSIGNMTLVIQTVLNQMNGKVNCLEPPEESFCGNRIVEGSEQCDCGFESDCSDPSHPDFCCYPQESPMSCRLVGNASCSPSAGPCCNESGCSFTPAKQNFTCLVEKDCSFASYCNGLSASCPLASPKADLSFCNSDTQICRSGQCTGSICEKINWTVCYMTAPSNDYGFDLSQLCYVSCLDPVSQTCVPTINTDEVKKYPALLQLLTMLGLTNTGIQLPSGAPCNNYMGYCDVFQKCRSVNEEGPLAKLTDLLFSQQALITVRDWVTVHWWAIILIGVGFVVGMALFIKFCAVHTPSSNPKKKPARKLGETLQRRRNPVDQILNAPRPQSDDREPIHTVSQGPGEEGKRKKRGQPPSSSRSKSSYRAQSSDNFEMRQAPLHYENHQFTDDFDRI